MPFEGSVTVSALEFASGEATVLTSLDLTGSSALRAGPGVTKFFSVDLTGIDGSTHLLTALCTSAKPANGHDAHSATAVGAARPVGAAGVANAVSFNEIALLPPYKMKLPAASVHLSVGSAANADGSVDIHLTTDKVALYVTLTTLAAGRFSDNAFALSGSATVKFLPFGAVDMPTLSESLRVEHLQQRI